jgi:hypothetical protein
MSGFIDWLMSNRGALQPEYRDPRESVGRQTTQRALAELDEIGEIGQGSFNPLYGLLRAVSAIEPAYRAATGVTTGAIQSAAEGFPFNLSESSSDRLGRDLLAMQNEAPLEMVAAPFAGLIDKAGEFGSMVKRSRPYLLGDTLEGNPDVMNLPEKGRPAAVGIPDEGRFSSRPIAEVQSASRNYMNEAGIDIPEYIEYPELDQQRAKYIAAAYERMKHDPDNPDVKAAYEALKNETMAQYEALRNTGIDFKFLREGQTDPYAKSPAMGYQDVVENKELTVFPTDFGYGSGEFDASDNPLLGFVGRVGDKEDAVANDAFRVVHDMFGHLGAGNPQFRAKGEERAWLEHSRMFSPEARKAMTTETRGQNSWLNSGPFADQNATALGADTVFADQKAGLLPDWAVDPEGMPKGIERDELDEIIKKWGK